MTGGIFAQQRSNSSQHNLKPPHHPTKPKNFGTPHRAAFIVDSSKAESNIHINIPTEQTTSTTLETPIVAQLTLVVSPSNVTLQGLARKYANIPTSQQPLPLSATDIGSNQETGNAGETTSGGGSPLLVPSPSNQSSPPSEGTEEKYAEVNPLDAAITDSSPPPPPASKIESCFTSFKQRLGYYTAFPCCSTRVKKACAIILNYVQKALPVASLTAIITLIANNGFSDSVTPWISLSSTIFGASIQILINKYGSQKVKRILNSLEKHNGAEVILYTLAVILFPHLETQMFYTYMSARAGMMYVQTFSQQKNSQNSESPLESPKANNKSLSWQDFFNQQFLSYVIKSGLISTAAFVIGSYAISSTAWLGLLPLFFRWLGTAAASSILGNLLHTCFPQHKTLQKIFSILQYFSVNPGTDWSYTLRTILFGIILGYNNANINADSQSQRMMIAKQATQVKQILETSPALPQKLKTALTTFKQSRAYRLCWRDVGKRCFRTLATLGSTIIAAAPWLMAANDPILLSNELPIYLIPISYLLTRWSYISPVLDQLHHSGKITISRCRQALNYLLNKNVMIMGAAYCYMLRTNFYLTYLGYKSESYERGFYTLPFVYGIFFVLLGMQYAALKYRQPFLAENVLKKLANSITDAEVQAIELTEAEAEWILDVAKHYCPELFKEYVEPSPAQAHSSNIELTSIATDAQQAETKNTNGPTVASPSTTSATIIIRKNPQILTAAALAIRGIFRSSTAYRAASTALAGPTVGFLDGSEACKGNNLITCGQRGGG